MSGLRAVIGLSETKAPWIVDSVFDDLAGLGHRDAPSPDAAPSAVVVLILTVVRGLVVVLVVSILVVDDFVVVFRVLDVVPDLERTRQCVDGRHDEELGHE